MEFAFFPLAEVSSELGSMIWNAPVKIFGTSSTRLGDISILFTGLAAAFHGAYFFRVFIRFSPQQSFYHLESLKDTVRDKLSAQNPPFCIEQYVHQQTISSLRARTFSHDCIIIGVVFQ